MYHEGERAVQRRAGVAADEWGSARVGATIPPVAAKFLAQQRMMVIGAATPGGAVWASLLTGPPGFITTSGDRTVVAAALPGAGDPLAGLFESERDIGLLAIEPARRRRMRINGRAHANNGRLTVHTEQVYANCPKYIQVRTPHGDGPTAVSARRAPVLTDEQQRWIAAADTFFITSHAAGLGVDTSHRGGNPGFVTVTGNRRLSWPDYTGNSMYMTLGNLDLDPRAGLLFLDWERGHTLQLTGRAHADWDPGRATEVPGAQRMVDFEVDQVVQIDEASPLRWSFGEYSRFNPSPGPVAKEHT
ncbi:pyridoxamine 5'-phosphate oxidase family protein [Actinophytocola sp.]|uniref:pyridoxamine 5'-phosphate oxidase family protein n=1 Tax=Actinophytocola sp. TaxID=1872138 RepID=UPI002ED4150E